LHQRRGSTCVTFLLFALGQGTAQVALTPAIDRVVTLALSDVFHGRTRVDVLECERPWQVWRPSVTSATRVERPACRTITIM